MSRGELWTAAGGTHRAGGPSSIIKMPRSKLGARIGWVSDTEMLSLSRALVVFLGLA